MIRAILISGMLVSVSYAQWSTDPNNNLIVGYGLFPELCSDSAGGAYVTYEGGSLSYPRQIKLHRLNRYGYQAWGAFRLIQGVQPESRYASLAADGRGGVLIAYLDRLWNENPKDPRYNDRVRVQRVDSSGTLLWGAVGVRATVDEHMQDAPTVVSDGRAGCIVAWLDSLGNLKINRVDSSGARVWGDSGRDVWNSPAKPPMVSDGRGGCYIRFGVGRLQRFDPQGNPYWPAPIQIPTSGGILRVDEDANVYLLGSKVLGYRNAELLFTVNLQKVDTLGNLLWDTLGVTIDTLNTNMLISWDFSLQNGYSTLSWPQYLGGVWDLRAQIVRNDGSTIFQNFGIAVSSVMSRKSVYGVIASDSSTIFVWSDNRSPGGTFAQRIDTLGESLWDLNDIFVCNPPYSGGGKVTTDGAGGFIVVGFIQSDFSIRAQQVSRNGNLGEIITSVKRTDIAVPQEVRLFQNFPNPFNSRTTIVYDLSRNDHVRLRLYNLLGQEVAVVVESFQPAGRHRVMFDSNNLPSGIYFYRLQTTLTSEIRKLVILK